MTDSDISEVWEALNRLSARLDALEAAKAMQQGAVGNSGYSDVSVIFAAPPNAPGWTDAVRVNALANGDHELHKEIEGTLQRSGYSYSISQDAWIKRADPNAPGLDTHDSGRVKYGAGMITY